MTTHGAGSEPRRWAFPEAPSHLAEQIEDRIVARASGRIRDLHVVLSESGIVLQGRSRTHHAKQLAHEAALDLIDLEVTPNLVNEIVVS